MNNIEPQQRSDQSTKSTAAHAYNLEDEHPIILALYPAGSQLELLPWHASLFSHMKSMSQLYDISLH